MCGIAGIIDKTGRLGSDTMRRLATGMADTMRYRGPDDSGVWVSPDAHIALSQRRLSIIDVSAGGHQPMLSSDGNGAITYNGEIYNFRELKHELETLGERFTSSSDTEVLLAALVRWQQAALERLDGMFAFGYWDAGRRSLLLARDIFGEKPLYYVDAKDWFAFASELHALTGLPGFDPTVTREAIASYLAFQYVPAPQTIYRVARKLEPGCWLEVDAEGRIRAGRHFSFITSGARASMRPIDELADELEALLVKTVKSRLISDVPIGAFLSGGVDSSTVVAIATKRLGIPLKTYSIGFEGHKDSEHLEAEASAAHLGTHHHEKVLSADVISLGTHIGTVLDEPNGDTSCLPTYLLAAFARESVTVALSGDGGDELFGGYGRYFVTADEWARKQKGDLSLVWWRAGEVYLSSRLLVFPDDELKHLMGSVPTGHADMLANLRARIERDDRPLLNIMRELDAAHYMPGAVLAKVDRMSMRHSLEVRAPLIGRDIAKFAMGLAMDDCYAAGQGKLVLKRVAERYMPQDWMRRPKRGFGVPMDMWGAPTLMPELKRLFADKDCKLINWIEPEHLTRYLARLEREFHPYRAWSLFILETWLRTHPAEVYDEPRAASPAGWRLGSAVRTAVSRFRSSSGASRPRT